MSKRYNIKELPASRLYAALPPERVPFAGSMDIPMRHGYEEPQPRALAALNLALNIQDTGYNIYLSGEANLGRTYMLSRFLEPRAKKSPTPPDLVYVNNFDDEDVPLLLRLPPGQGQKLKSALGKALQRIRKELPACMDRDSHVQRRAVLRAGFQDKKNHVFKDMDKVAVEHGFKLDLDENGAMSICPMFKGRRLSEQDFDKLPLKVRNSIKDKGESLTGAMHGYMRRLDSLEQELLEAEQAMEKEVAAEVLDTILGPLAEKFAQTCKGSLPESYLTNVRNDLLENLDYLLPVERNPQVLSLRQPQPPENPPFDEIAHRYDLNIFVDNSKVSGAPLVLEDHPTSANLLGCLERESEMGALVTNFTLIKSGALHRANGGFLILHMEDILQHPQAWEGLLRALRAGQAKIDDPGDGDGPKTKGIRPEPVPLKLKVILIGDDELYDFLLDSDSRFIKLFKIKAHMTGHMPRDAKGIRIYLAHIRHIVEEAALPHFDRAALASLVDFGSLLLEDQKNLSLEFPLLRELMVEAAAHARMNHVENVSLEHLNTALEMREFRLNMIEESFLEDYDRKLIKVRTHGRAIGQINGLSVTRYGDYEFGLPHQISCTVGVGHDGIMDLEREAQLGGPIHTKASMILKSYLVALFARSRPLFLTGSICFEQNYMGIEGDSASGAELAALLSAIAQVPLCLNLAFTGALSQSGQIMAVGGVSRKVEGFFEVCRRRRLSGDQGVIIPKDNLDHLMLKKSLRQAVQDGTFHIYPVEHISHAMELLTGMACGQLRKDGGFTPGSLFQLVDRRLRELCVLGQQPIKKSPAKAHP